MSPPSPARSPLATHNWRILLALGTLYTVWSTTYLAVHHLVSVHPPLLSGGVRMLLAAGLLSAFLWFRGVSFPSQVQLRGGLLSGALMFVGGQGLLTIAQQHISSGTAALVVATVPLWMAVLEFALGKAPSRLEWFAMALGLCGVASLTFHGELLATSQGWLWLVLAPLCWSAGVAWSRRIPSSAGGVTSALQMTGGGLGLLLAAWLRGEQVPRSFPVAATWSFLYLVVFGSLIAYSAFGYLVEHTRPALALSYAYVNPVLAIALGTWLGGERVDPSLWLALPLIVVAVALTVGEKGRPDSVAAEPQGDSSEPALGTGLAVLQPAGPRRADEG